MNLSKRVQAPTPKFFRILRAIGLVLASTGGVLLTAPLSLPVFLVSAGGYLVVAGGVLSAVSQITVDDVAVEKGISKDVDDAQ
ncbi:hypothetical protein ACI6PS_07985 [Flavobacterium sp. PLA-1-15]|uniref:hypothetical protein n=1 Tax=Flavobacterium sp. PLA-1-15 TaxID=3380533 RepID=UPI003B819382